MSSAEVFRESPYRPPMNWFETRTKSDTDYVEKVRKNLSWIDRWGCWLFGFHLACIVGFAAATSKIIDIVQSMSAYIQTPAVACAVAVILGSKFGFLLMQSVLAICQIVFGNRQSRMLVRYYDELHGKPDSTSVG